MIVRRFSTRSGVWLFPAALAGMALLSVLVRARMATRWLPSQVLSATGLDQVWVFDGKYLVILGALLLLWGLPFASLLRDAGWRATLSSLPFQFAALTAFAILVFPGSVLIPGYKHSLAYIGDRMSLPL